MKSNPTVSFLLELNPICNRPRDAFWFIRLMMCMNTVRSEQVIKGLRIVSEAGQCLITPGELAQSWNTSRPTVIKFLKYLVETGNIEMQAIENKCTMITIKWQPWYDLNLSTPTAELQPQLDDLGSVVPESSNEQREAERKVVDTKKRIIGISPEVECFIRDEFEVIRRSYPGTKLGAEHEVMNFMRKYGRECVAILKLMPEAIEREKQYRNRLKSNKEFTGCWPMLGTWVNQSRWEAEYEHKSSGSDYSGMPRVKEWKDGKPVK